jgi:hypothetical protein
MHAFARLRLGALAIVALAALLALPSGALADKPIQNRGDYEFIDVIPAEVCGFPITIAGSGTFHELFVVNQAAGNDLQGDPIPSKVTVHIKETGTYSANGKTLEYSVAAQFVDTDIVHVGTIDYTDPETGTTYQGDVFTLEHHERGIPIKISLPNGRRITVDAGNLVFEGVSIVRYLDENGDIQVRDLVEPNVTVHGPHPLFNSNRFCEVMTQYLG